MINNLQIKSTLSIDELIGDLRQLDEPTLQYLIHSLQRIQSEREEKNAADKQFFWQLLEKIDWSKQDNEKRLKP